MTDPIHICILTTAHPIDDVRVNNKFGAAFRGAGFKVSWVGPGHAFFDAANYNRYGFEFVLGPPIRGRLSRMLARHRLRRLVRNVRHVDVYYCPDPDSAELAVRLARRNGARVVFDIHEMFHKALLTRWLKGHQLGVLSEYIRGRIARTCARCELVVGVSATVLDAFVPGDAHNRLVVRSCAPAWFASSAPADVCGPERVAFTFMHGKGGRLRGTLAVLQAASIASKQVSGLRVIVIHQGDAQDDGENRMLLSSAEALRITDVLDMRKGVPMHEMPGILAGCDVGLIAWQRSVGEDVLPNRLFEYMAAGLPVLGPSYAPEIARILDAEQCGRLADFENPADIAREMVYLRQNPEVCREMGRRAREAFLARYNWESEVRPLLDRIRSWFPHRASA